MNQRKVDHIMLAASSAPATLQGDSRFYYEPLLAAHPSHTNQIDFLGKILKHPLWISSMTGGSEQAGRINHLLAEACAEFGLGIGLGSCRALLHSNDFFDDFNLRPILGNSVPLYANIGIVQVEELLAKQATLKIDDLIDKLDADGIFIHLNPVQEWLQPEGGRQKKPALETLDEFLASNLNRTYKILIKEVGQGIGPESLKKLLELPIDGIEFGAYGGTNFANIELMRHNGGATSYLYPLATFGHNVYEMLECINDWSIQNPKNFKQLIISGGVRNFLDGYYCIGISKQPAIYGMANAILQQALSSKTDLYDFIQAEIDGYRFAQNFLRIKQITQ